MKRPVAQKISLSAAAGLLLILTACGSQPANTAQEPGQPTQPEQPAQTPQQPAPEASANAEWEQILEAAKKEGQVIVTGQPGANSEQMVMAFENYYPDIKVKYTGARPSETVPKLIAEQSQNRYLTDILLDSGQNVITDLKPLGGVEDVRDYIILPEVKEDQYWRGGFEQGFEMAANSGQYVSAVIPYPALYINNDVIPKEEFTKFEDLIDPKFKGQMLVNDFSRPAQGNTLMTAMYMTYGEDFVNQFIANEPMLFDDLRQIVENWASGKYPIGLGLSEAELTKFIENGIVKNWTKIDPDPITSLHPLTLAVLKNPPNPNATKVFVNWYLGKDGQIERAKVTEATGAGSLSRRTDVPEPDVPLLAKWEQVQYRDSLLSPEAVEVRAQMLELGKTYKQSLTSK